MKLRQLFFLVLLPLLCGCAGQSAIADIGERISIQSASVDSAVDSRTFLVSIDSLLLMPDSGSYVSSVQDVCVSDSNVIVLDVAKTVFVFALGDGRQVAKLEKVGRGRGEYIAPKAICIRGDTLYVLDFQTK